MHKAKKIKKPQIGSKHTLGQMILHYRESKGISVRELAKELGISFSMVSAIQREKIFPRRRILERLADLLEVSAPDLQKLDTRLRIDHLRIIVEKNPDLNGALSIMVERIREGRTPPAEFAKAILAATASR